ncbi:disease resistance 1 [Musa troglodytarum]|uniref:Disease resistance 1 n=1 Tax=Musa troglodytarum TaxID=320322 RepID=A0A9E7GGA0_9LILI|nr:disease resistance 1 [Musa troglodytarum]
MSASHGLCRFCLIFVLTIVFLALLFYLTYRPIKPVYYLTAFSLLLNSSSSSAPGAVVASFELAIKNRNKELGVYHDDLGLSLSLPPFNSSSSATAVVPGFYQGHHRTASKEGFFNPSSSSSKRPWAAVANGSAVLLIAVESAVRYKAVAWRSRRHRVSLAAEVAIDREGKKTAEDRIRFHSGAPRVCRDAPFRHSITAVVLVAFAALMLNGRL